MASRIMIVAATVAGVAASGCTDTNSATNLFPELPPMILQVRLKQSFVDANGIIHANQRVFSYGSNPLAIDTDTPDPDMLTAAAVKQSFRIITSDLLVGNNLEEIQCRAQVDDDDFDAVPLGATPDDIAGCSAAQDTLPQTCKGDHAVCLCHKAAGCIVGTETIAENAPVGVFDKNQDGAADDSRFIKGAVELICTGAGTHNVAIDLDASYWNPSGDQQEPAKGGFDALGPAIVLATQGVGVVNAVLPSNTSCNFKFSPSVVDKKGMQICAAPGGFGKPDVDIHDLSCDQGDTAAANFKTEPLFFQVFGPLDGLPFSRTGSITISAADTIPLDPTTINNIQLLENGAPYTDFSLALNPDGNIITLAPTLATGLDPGANYTLVIPTTLTDTFGEPNVEEKRVDFTTGP